MDTTQFTGTNVETKTVKRVNVNAKRKVNWCKCLMTGLLVAMLGLGLLG